MSATETHKRGLKLLVPRSFGRDEHAHYCGSAYEAPDRGIGAMRTYACAEECVETVNGKLLCPVCDEHDMDELRQCDECGLMQERDQMTRQGSQSPPSDWDWLCTECAR